jgi:hypothetical protein
MLSELKQQQISDLAEKYIGREIAKGKSFSHSLSDWAWEKALRDLS